MHLKFNNIYMKKIKLLISQMNDFQDKTTLAIGYGQTPFGLMNKSNMTLPNATFIHSQIVNYYKVFQDWSKSIIAKVMQRGYFLTKYGLINLHSLVNSW